MIRLVYFVVAVELERLASSIVEFPREIVNSSNDIELFIVLIGILSRIKTNDFYNCQYVTDLVILIEKLIWKIDFILPFIVVLVELHDYSEGF